jgi:uncharacterized protein (DUF3084 family)
VQEQARNFEPQRKELARLVALREQNERQLSEVDARVAQKRSELLHLQEEIRVREEQRQKLSRLPVGDVAVQAKVEAAAAEPVKVIPQP